MNCQLYIESGSVIFLRVKQKVMRLKNHPENQGKDLVPFLIPAS
jgi:hypothetical protein